MSHLDVIRAWKDDSYRSSLSPSQQALLPRNPVGEPELLRAEFDVAAAGEASNLFTDPWICMDTEYDTCTPTWTRDCPLPPSTSTN